MLGDSLSRLGKNAAPRAPSAGSVFGRIFAIIGATPRAHCALQLGALFSRKDSARAKKNVAGAFSGKDPSKVDRSAAYAARYVAKNIVAAGLATQCEVQVSYAIGVAEPINITVYTDGTGMVPDEQLAKLVSEHFDLRPRGIVNMLDLLRPIYTKTAAYGHFGRSEPEFTWEATDRAADLKKAI